MFFFPYISPSKDNFWPLYLNPRTTTTRRLLHSVLTEWRKQSFLSTSTSLSLWLTFWKLRRSTTSTHSSFALFWNGKQHSSYLLVIPGIILQTFVSKVRLPDQIPELEEDKIAERAFLGRRPQALDPVPCVRQHRGEWSNKGGIHNLSELYLKTCSQGTEDTELTLTREGDYIVSTDDNVEEINIFEGQFNRITFEQVYTKTFKCTYQLQLYPFDTQVSAQEKDQWGCPRCVRWTWWWGSWRPRWCRSPPTS